MLSWSIFARACPGLARMPPIWPSRARSYLPMLARIEQSVRRAAYIQQNGKVDRPALLPGCRRFPHLRAPRKRKRQQDANAASSTLPRICTASASAPLQRRASSCRISSVFISHAVYTSRPRLYSRSLRFRLGQPQGVCRNWPLLRNATVLRMTVSLFIR